MGKVAGNASASQAGVPTGHQVTATGCLRFLQGMAHSLQVSPAGGHNHRENYSFRCTAQRISSGRAGSAGFSFVMLTLVSAGRAVLVTASGLRPRRVASSRFQVADEASVKRLRNQPASIGLIAHQPRLPGRGRQPGWRAWSGRRVGWSGRGRGGPRRRSASTASWSVVMPPKTKYVPHRGPSSGVAAHAGSSSVPRGHDSPGPSITDRRLPQQIGHLLRKTWPALVRAINSTTV
jgi:hypothetical protein